MDSYIIDGHITKFVRRMKRRNGEGVEREKEKWRTTIQAVSQTLKHTHTDVQLQVQ